MAARRPTPRHRLVVGALAGLLLCGRPAGAMAPDLVVSFTEASPEDRFVIENTSACQLSIQSVTIDLAGSAGRMVFDTEPGGAGYNVYQPFAARDGLARLARASTVSDGDTQLTLDFSVFEPGALFAFTIDTDDRLAQSIFGPGVIDGSELAGATVTVIAMLPAGLTRTDTAAFGTGGRAEIFIGQCAMS